MGKKDRDTSHTKFTVADMGIKDNLIVMSITFMIGLIVILIAALILNK